jgi:hypothetical protein
VSYDISIAEGTIALVSHLTQPVERIGAHGAPT